jgi:hypothetical protein
LFFAFKLPLFRRCWCSSPTARCSAGFAGEEHLQRRSEETPTRAKKLLGQEGVVISFTNAEAQSRLLNVGLRYLFSHAGNGR